VSECGSHRRPPLYVCTTGLGTEQDARQRELQNEQHERKEQVQRTTSCSENRGPTFGTDPTADKRRATHAVARPS